MKKILKFDSGARAFERVVTFLILLALGFLVFGIYFLVTTLNQTG